MQTIQKVWTTGGSRCITINPVVANELDIEPGDLVKVDIVAVKKPNERWENVEEE